MTQEMINKYAKLLVEYSLELKQGEKLYINTTTLAQELVRAIFLKATKIGVIVEVDMSFADQNTILLQDGNDQIINHLPILKSKAMEEFDAYLVIRAPFNLTVSGAIDAKKRKMRTEALSAINSLYFERTADRSLKRSLCQFPTQSSADAADMSLEEYGQFIYNACKLNEDDPEAAWLDVRAKQQGIVDFLNRANQINYKSDKTDISFSVKDRIWINSDGQTNMPSGEVFTGPIEDSVNGHVHFDYPSIYMGKAVENITLYVEKGEVVKWEAEKGKEVLDEVFEIPGARRFGEVAIGTNYSIQRATKNILFDEKIGGTIHMAVGQSYKQTGAKNKSAIHWDMISNMKDGGQITVDDQLIYENGVFLI